VGEALKFGREPLQGGESTHDEILFDRVECRETKRGHESTRKTHFGPVSCSAAPQARASGSRLGEKLELGWGQPAKLFAVRGGKRCFSPEGRRGDHAVDERSASPTTLVEEIRRGDRVLRVERCRLIDDPIDELDFLRPDRTAEELGPNDRADADRLALSSNSRSSSSSMQDRRLSTLGQKYGGIDRGINGAAPRTAVSGASSGSLQASSTRAPQSGPEAARRRWASRDGNRSPQR
jgi:hypothetical protein